MFRAQTIIEARMRRDEIIKDYQGVAHKAMEVLDNGFEDAMTVMLLPEEIRIPLRTSNHLERENGELERRSSVISIFPNVASVNRLMGATLMERHDLMSTRSSLFTRLKFSKAIQEAKIHLLEVASEQIKLLRAA